MNQDQFKQAFLDEAEELLSSLEDKLLELEAHPDDKERISAVFRVMHTIKGSAAMFGFDVISEYTHHIENIMDRLRNGEIAVNRELIDHTLKARDHIFSMLNAAPDEWEGYKALSKELVRDFKTAIGLQDEVSAEGEESGAEEEEDVEKVEQTFRIRFYPHETLFLSGTNPLLLLRELAAMGECLIIPKAEKMPPLDKIDPEKCYIGWDILLTTDRPLNEVQDVFIFVEGESELKVDTVETYDEIFQNVEAKKLGEILLSRGLIDESRLEQALNEQKRLGQILKDKKLLPSQEVSVALKEQEHIRKIQEKRVAVKEESSIRVKSDKLDALVNLVGELVTIHARVMEESLKIGESELLNVAEQFGRITDSLRENTMSIRMLPIGTTFSKFRRVVRDMSNDLGKKIDLKTEGGETELDKTVIEKLNDPLVHIIRNSVDHGIEKPDIRKSQGKTEAGTVRLSARHAGASVVIEIWDDGAGLNRERIIKKAREKGILNDAENLTDSEIFGLIFAPGFSTAEKVTNVSGRGVGMDVVKRQIESLNGHIHVESQEGRFTRISLRLPLTLAIIDGFLVRIAESYYVFPLSAVEACLEVRPEDKQDHPHRSVLNYRGSLMPYVDVRQHFGFKGERPEIEQMVVARSKEINVGFLVDQVIGNNQTVIKSLGKTYKEARGVSGATILGNGTIALIVDIDGLVEYAIEEELTALDGQ